jgi:hypothetical protein
VDALLKIVVSCPIFTRPIRIWQSELGWRMKKRLRTLCTSVQELRAIFEEVSWDIEEFLDLVGHGCDCEVGNWEVCEVLSAILVQVWPLCRL